ncbi:MULTISPECIES: hypothetical protein [unclassified Rhodanobacter]|uniref:hypothetical protein n=2 Tax=Rhodanobacter TaxID=75309 RepID=UPI000B07D03C|nr:MULTISPECIES: hypothetical protein [unclassified Rhodanobacter]
MNTPPPRSDGPSAFTPRQAAAYLRGQHHVALCLIENGAAPHDWQASSYTTPEALLDSLVAVVPEYAWTAIDGRCVLHPRQDIWRAPLSGEAFRGPRLQTAQAYVEFLRGNAPEMADLVPPLLKGDPAAALYTATVSIRANCSALQGLVDLLGPDPSMVFAIERQDANRRVLFFERVDMGRGHHEHE